MRSSSGRPGSSIGREPAAMMQLSNSIFSPSTSISVGEAKRASPVMTRIFRRFASPASPPVSLPTTSPFHSSRRSMSIFGSP